MRDSEIIARSAVARADVKVRGFAGAKTDPACLVIVEPGRLSDSDHRLPACGIRYIGLRRTGLISGDHRVKGGPVYVIYIKAPIGREIGLKRHTEQAALAGGIDRAGQVEKWSWAYRPGANKGRLKPVATIWVCNCASAGGIHAVAAKAAASKMEKNLFMIAPWNRLYRTIEITKVRVLYLYRQRSVGC